MRFLITYVWRARGVKGEAARKADTTKVRKGHAFELGPLLAHLLEGATMSGLTLLIDIHAKSGEHLISRALVGPPVIDDGQPPIPNHRNADHLSDFIDGGGTLKPSSKKYSRLLACMKTLLRTVDLKSGSHSST